MKAFKSLNNVEMAKMLAQLFPDSMSFMVKAVENYCNSVIDNQDEARKAWNVGLISFDFWLNICKNILEVIKENSKGIDKKPGWFSDQLFDGYLSLVSAHALLIFARTEGTDKKLSSTINLFFGD